MNARRIQRIVSDDPALAALWRQTQSLRDLQRIYEAWIPLPLRVSSRIGYVLGNELRVLADSGAIASRLRLLLPALLDEFRSKGCDFSAIRVAVQVRPTRTGERKHLAKQIDDEGRQALRALSETLPDTPLRAALERLVRGSG